ncbi:alpha-amylase family protein [Terrimonas pollutisoli]|uniref:alpha-amylase family protein n=1 Tax=Terrimonas pollutisoli TaxID=3034147 RepID=UPI0023EB3460|nr:alpha-amylase family protein [Terrimonas sp. H1YJ31]
MDISRRKFLASTSIVTAASLFADPLFAFQPLGNPVDDWYLRMRRVAQHNLNEYDPQNLDIDYWVNYWAELKLDAIILTGGGLMAMYPTKIAGHYKSQFLGDRDLFGDYLKALKKKHIRVIARIETNYLHKDIFNEYPQWFERNADGSPREHAETPWIYRTCLFSNYRNEQVPKIMNEIMSRYDVDGFFTNSWPQVGGMPRICHCDSCKSLGKLSRKEISEEQMKRTLETINKITNVVNEKKSGIIYNVNIAGGIGAIQNIKKIGDKAKWITCDHQGRGGNTPVWDCAQQGRVAYSVMKGKPVTNVVGIKTGAWRHSTNSEAETMLWLAQTTSSGMIPWWVYLGSEVYDKRWMEIGRKYYQWLAKHERHFFNKRSMSRLGVVFSQKLNELYDAPGNVPGGYGGRPVDPNAKGNPIDYLQGIYYALLEGRFPFDLIHEDDLRPETLKNYDALIMPNIALLSDEQAGNIRSFVKNGGSLLATFETGLYDEWGSLRNDFALADVFDIRLMPGYKKPKGQIFYASINAEHAIVNGFGDTTILPGGEYYVPATAPGNHVLTIIPPYPNGIPEMVYAHQRKELDYPGQKSNEPAMVIREKGKSRLIYFPSDIDKNTWTRSSADLSKLIQQSVSWMLKGESVVSVQGDGNIEIFVWETEPGFAIHILNYNNPNMARASIRKFYPIGEQKVKMTLPDGVTITKGELIRSETPLKFKQTGNLIEFTISSIEDFEIAALYKS